MISDLLPTAEQLSDEPQLADAVGLNSLGFAKTPAETLVVVAMSGGVDSSTVAAMLVEEGYNVVGITLQLYDHGVAIQRKGACCAGADIQDARRVAATLGIKHFVLDYESRFRQQVMDDFADSYLRGETPIPCIRCNQTVKFNDLLETAQELGADCLATGHYVRRMAGDGGVRLLRGRDAGKDQSYFLFATTAEQLAYLRFPLGRLDKAETRAIARRHGLAIAEKPDSQDICFVPAGRYGDLVRRLRPGAVTPGPILDTEGRELGRHNGIIDYTIGQRRGLGIGGRRSTGRDRHSADLDVADTEPLFVIAIEAERNAVIVGTRDQLACVSVTLKEINWLAATPPLPGRQVLARLRNTAQPLPAEITVWGSDDANANTDTAAADSAVIRLLQPQFGIATGQAAVLYDAENPDWVLGGGWITAAPTGNADTAG